MPDDPKQLRRPAGDRVGSVLHHLVYEDPKGSSPRERRLRVPVIDNDGKVHLVYPIDAREWVARGLGRIGTVADFAKAGAYTPSTPPLSAITPEQEAEVVAAAAADVVPEPADPAAGVETPPEPTGGGAVDAPSP